MKLRTRYLLAGVAWALFLAPAATYLVLGAVAGALWLFVFGDAPWPAALDWVLPGIGGLVFLTVGASCIHLARVRGLRRESDARHDAARTPARPGLWTLVPLLLIALTAGMLWLRSVDQSRALAEAARREAVFAARLETRHTIAGLVVRRSGGGDVEAGLRVSGGRPGPYRLAWQVRDRAYGKLIAGDARTLDLGRAGDAVAFGIPFDRLARGYRDAILSGGGVVVDEDFDLVVALEPAIDAAETRDWPEFERARWERGETPLRSSATAPVRLRFRVDRDGTIDPSVR